MNNQICPNCRAANAADVRFCTNCGQSFYAAPQPPPNFAAPNSAYSNQPFPPQNAAPGKRGNVPAHIARIVLIIAVIVTVFAMIDFKFYWLGYKIGFPSSHSGRSFLEPAASVLLTLITLLIGGTALILRLANPNRFGLLKSSLTAVICAAIMLLMQIVLIGHGASEGSRWRASYEKPNQTLASASPSPVVSNRAPTPAMANSNSSAFKDLGEYRQCSQESVTRSVNKGGAATMTFVNNSRVALRAYPLKSDGKRSELYHQVESGQSRTEKSSTRGEWWVITDTSGNCKALVEAPNTIKID